MAAATTHALRRALARAEQGKAVSVAEAAALMEARGPDLERLGMVAAHLRDLGSGDRITYSRKVFIPLTMLCRDHCHYCTFAKPPAKLSAPYLTPDEVLSIARGGRERACKEALFTLGDRPEDRYEVARTWLSSRGYGSTLEYVRAAAISVIEETGLLPHLNPGVMSYEELARLQAGERIDGADARDVVRSSLPARRPALRLAGQAPGRPVANDRGCRPSRDPVHHRHPRRDRRGSA